MQELALQPGHVDTGRAFGLASLAFETQIENWKQLGID
jgi:hypothetical protein